MQMLLILENFDLCLVQLSREKISGTDNIRYSNPTFLVSDTVPNFAALRFSTTASISIIRCRRCLMLQESCIYKSVIKVRFCCLLFALADAFASYRQLWSDGCSHAVIVK